MQVSVRALRYIKMLEILTGRGVPAPSPPDWCVLAYQAPPRGVVTPRAPTSSLQARQQASGGCWMPRTTTRREDATLVCSAAIVRTLVMPSWFGSVLWTARKKNFHSTRSCCSTCSLESALVSRARVSTANMVNADWPHVSAAEFGDRCQLPVPRCARPAPPTSPSPPTAPAPSSPRSAIR